MPKQKKKIKEEKIDKAKKVKYSVSDSAENFVDQWTKQEPDYIFGMKAPKAENLGVSRGLYSYLPNLERIVALQRDTAKHCFPLNKMMEIYGPESVGKTTLLKYFANLFLSYGGIAVFVDFEHKFDPRWLRIMGQRFKLTEEDYHRFLYIDPPHFEWFMIWIVKMMNHIIASKDKAEAEIKELEAMKKKPNNYHTLINIQKKVLSMPVVILIDSIASIYTKAEVEGEEETYNRVMELARGFALNLKHIRRHLGKSNTLIIAANQERDKIAMGGMRVMPGMMVTPGGHAWKHYADGRIKMRSAGPLKRTRDSIESVYGTEQILTMTKNQMGIPPFKTASLRLIYNNGYDTFYSLLESCVEEKLIKKDGTKYHISAGKFDLLFGETEIDEIEQQYPTLEGLLHNIYRKHCGV